MEQLRMTWERNPLPHYDLPTGFIVRNFRAGDVAAWLQLCLEGGLTKTAELKEYQVAVIDLIPQGLVPERDIFFVCGRDHEPVATIIAFVHTDDKDRGKGHIHMVAADPAVRGRGIGNALMTIAMDKLYAEGCGFAFLKTDDFRLPAIKTYLNHGFVPDLTLPGMRERWEKISEALGGRRIV